MITCRVTVYGTEEVFTNAFQWSQQLHTNQQSHCMCVHDITINIQWTLWTWRYPAQRNICLPLLFCFPVAYHCLQVVVERRQTQNTVTVGFFIGNLSYQFSYMHSTLCTSVSRLLHSIKVMVVHVCIWPFL